MRLAEAGTTFYFNRLLELELEETSFLIALKERHPKNWRRYRYDGRVRPRASRLMDEVTMPGKTFWMLSRGGVWRCTRSSELCLR